MKLNSYSSPGSSLSPHCRPVASPPSAPDPERCEHKEAVLTVGDAHWRSVRRRDGHWWSYRGWGSGRKETCDKKNDVTATVSLYLRLKTNIFSHDLAYLVVNASG